MAVLRFGPALLPGPFLGALLVNAVSIDMEDPVAFRTSATICLAFATGAMLRALIGWFLIRKCVGSTALQRTGDVVRFFLLGGQGPGGAVSSTGGGRRKPLARNSSITDATRRRRRVERRNSTSPATRVKEREASMSPELNRRM